MPTLDATVAGPNANSFATLAEANTYFDERLPLPTPWVASGDNAIRALLMATRVLGAFVQPLKVFIAANSRYRSEAYYVVRREWTGAAATTTQRLAWPRSGMFDANGNAIAEDVIPLALKEAQAELAGQLLMSDTTLDNAITVGGIKSVKAGSVAVTFNEMIAQHVLPDAVWMLLPASWLTDEIIESVGYGAEFDVVSD